MKKLLAICLTFIMVFSLTVVPSMAATVEVPAKTIFDQSFAGLSAAPADWTVTGSATYTETGILTGHHETEGSTRVNYNELFNAGKADYTFTVKFANYSGVSKVHFGADTAANAVSSGTNVSGYTLTATPTSNYKSGNYKLYKDGTEIAAFTDADSNYGYQSIRTFSFEVTDSAVIVTGPFTGSPITIEDADPIKSGYVGMWLTNNNQGSTIAKLGAMSLTTDAYSYTVDSTQTVTGAYVVTGQEWVESHTGTMYYNQSLAGLSAGNAPEGVTIPSSNVTYETDYIQLTAFKNPTVNFGTKTVNEGAWTIEAKYGANTTSNKVQFYFLGYQLRTGYNDGGVKLYQGSTLLAEAGTSAYSPWGNNHVTVPVVKVEYANGKMNVYMDDYHVFKDVEIASPTYTGEVKIFNNYGGGSKIYYVKLYTPDYADTSAYVTTKKTNFLLDKTFTDADTEAEVAADGFALSGDNRTFTENGMENTQNGRVMYTGAKLGGAYTAEFVARKPYASTILYVNADATVKNGYSISAIQSSGTESTVGISKLVDGTATALELENPNDFVSINSADQKYKVVVAPQENGDVKITVTIDSKTFEATDVASDENVPYTEGYIGVMNSVGTTNRIKSIKAYPTSVAAPAYEGKFDIGGTVASAAAKGNTYFTFPVTMLGQSPDFIAALYEDGKMTDIKFYDVDEVNAAPVALFDTTASTANKVEIKVFVWDTLAGMVPVLAPFTLD